MIKKEDLIYIAGFFDGEGSITISKLAKNTNGISPSYRLYIAIANTDKGIINYLDKVLGIGRAGGTYRKDHKRKWVYHWGCGATKARDILLDLLPHLKIKRKQAILAVKFQNDMNKTKKKCYKNSPLDKDVLEKREKMRRKMVKLNGRNLRVLETNP